MTNITHILSFLLTGLCFSPLDLSNSFFLQHLEESLKCSFFPSRLAGDHLLLLLVPLRALLIRFFLPSTFPKMSAKPLCYLMLCDGRSDIQSHSQSLPTQTQRGTIAG
jgi:hypothetical protein